MKGKYFESYCGVAKGKDAWEIITNLDFDPDFCMVFCSPKYIDQIPKMGDETDAKMIGCTTAGEIHNFKPYDGHLVLFAIKSKYFRVGVGIGENVTEDGVKAGEEAARMALKDLNFDPYLRSLYFYRESLEKIARLPNVIGICLPDGLSEQEENILEGMRNVVGTNPIIGGSAGDDLKIQKTYQFYNWEVYENAVAFAAIASDLRSSFISVQGWKPLGLTGVATDSKGRRVYSINDRPAAEVYGEWLGKKLRPKVIAWEEGLTNPLAIVDVAGELWLRHPKQIFEDGSISFFSRVPENAVLEITSGRKEDLIEAAREAGKRLKISEEQSFSFIFDCVARKVYLGKDTDKELAAFNESIKGESVGFFTYGEQAPTAKSVVGHRNQTFTAITFFDELIV